MKSVIKSNYLDLVIRVNLVQHAQVDLSETFRNVSSDATGSSKCHYYASVIEDLQY